MTIFLGWMNVLLIFLLVFVYIGRMLDKYVFSGRPIKFYGSTLKKLIKISSQWHIYLAILLIISAGLHGYLALGGYLYPHSGYFLFLAILLSGINGILFKKFKKKNLFLAHKLSAIFAIILLVWHISSM